MDASKKHEKMRDFDGTRQPKSRPAAAVKSSGLPHIRYKIWMLQFLGAHSSRRSLPTVGPVTIPREGTLVDLLFNIPYFFPGRIVPPQAIVNEVLLSGCKDAGMSGGCKWKPFQVDDTQYARLVADLKRRRFQVIQSPAWVRTLSDWHRWCGEIVWGIPALESKARSDKIQSLDEEFQAAKRRGHHNRAANLASELVDLCIEYSRFINQHRSSRPKLHLFSPPPRKRT